MLTPYDWQEGISHRAQFVEARLATGSPVVAVSLESGVLALTVRRQTRKIYEIYDRIFYAAIGAQSDVESLRTAALDFCHSEGYRRSEEDVTLQRVAATLSQPLKKAFADFNTAPFIVKSLFVEISPSREDDLFCLLESDGDFSFRNNWAILSPSHDKSEPVRTEIRQLSESKSTVKAAIPVLKKVWSLLMIEDGSKSFAELTEDLTCEIAFLDRSRLTDACFELLEG